jgi:L-lactate dehydrogenase complex protein LldG
VPEVGGNPLPPGGRPANRPSPAGPGRPTWRVPATGPTPAVGGEAWRATTPVTGRQRAVDLPAARSGQPVPTTPDPAASIPVTIPGTSGTPDAVPEGLASSKGGTRLTAAWRPAAPAPRPVAATPPAVAGLEHGDRGLFLALARRRMARGVPVDAVHPMAAPPGDEPRPGPEPAGTDPVDGDLVAPFARAVEDAGGVCHVVEGEIPETLLDHIVAELGGWEAVISAEPEAAALGQSLAGRGVEVRPAGRDAAARATLGVTSAVAGVAATGSIVLDSRRAGGRLASLLPPVHVCVLPADRIVAAPADVLRGLGRDPARLPPWLGLVTGPSRTGDIEQILTIGAHGPTALHVIVVAPAPRAP